MRKTVHCKTTATTTIRGHDLFLVTVLVESGWLLLGQSQFRRLRLYIKFINAVAFFARFRVVITWTGTLNRLGIHHDQSCSGELATRERGIRKFWNLHYFFFLGNFKNWSFNNLMVIAELTNSRCDSQTPLPVSLFVRSWISSTLTFDSRRICE